MYSYRRYTPTSLYPHVAEDAAGEVEPVRIVIGVVCKRGLGDDEYLGLVFAELLQIERSVILAGLVQILAYGQSSALRIEHSTRLKS